MDVHLKSHDHDEGTNSPRNIDDGDYDQHYGDGGIAANLFKHQKSQPNNQEPRFGQNNQYDSDNTPINIRKHCKL